MGSEKKAFELKDESCQAGTLSIHSLSNLRAVPPIVFLYLVKECYASGTLKATAKFRVLQQQVCYILHNDPQPGPAIFVIQCLHMLPMLGTYSEGFSHLLISGLRRFLKSNTADSSEAKDLAAKLFVDIMEGIVEHNDKIAAKIIEVFDVGCANIEIAIVQGQANGYYCRSTALEILEQYISRLVEGQSYLAAVTMLEHFAIRKSGQAFLLEMLEKNQFMAAEKWATFMGKPMLCTLVREYVDRNKLKFAYLIVKKNNLEQDFPEWCLETSLYDVSPELVIPMKEFANCSSLKKLAEKGCWDVAENKTKGSKQLIEYLVYRAMEAGYSEKVEELCDRFSLEGFPKIKETDTGLLHSQRYLQLKELAVEEIVWVDNAELLHRATCHMEECKVVGLDCEWKPNYIKGSKPRKVSILQIAADKFVFILDLIRLSMDVPDILDSCLTRILHSPRVLKLGYNFQCDMKQLDHSYGSFGCFKQYEMLLDIQNIFKERSGGLSGLAEKILGAGLNKTRRNSNWEERPLSQNQLEYAAMDAAVLIHIFQHVRNHPRSATKGDDQAEWKSHIVSLTDSSAKNTKNKDCRSKR